MPSHLIALDPGLDVSAAALFDLSRWEESKRDFAAAVGALSGTLTFSTQVHAPVHSRLGVLFKDLIRCVDDYSVSAAYIERPAIEGNYGVARRNQRRESVNRMYEARGALLAALGTMNVDTYEYRAGTSSKEQRRAMLERVLAALGKTLPTGPRGGKREDEWDAIWIGAWALSTRYERDLHAALTNTRVIPHES